MIEPVTVPVYALHTDTIRRADPAEMEKRMPERMKKAGRYRFERDRLLCIGAGLLMLRVLGIPDESVLEYGTCGKPSAPGYLPFNVSHSGDWCILAAGPDPVGADIEKPAASVMDIAPRVFTPAERSWMSESPAERFFRLWTWKESVMKATGLGMNLAPESFEVLPFTRNEPVVLNGRRWYAASGNLDGCVFSVCSASPMSVSLRIVTEGPEFTGAGGAC